MTMKRFRTGVRQSALPTVLVGVLTLVAARPASAANKEHQQLMADLRMLQEQAQLLQNALGTLADAIKAVNTRLDQQAEANRRAVADEKLLIDTLTNDLRVVREKADDNNVRVGSLSQEIDALRQLVQQALTRQQQQAAPPDQTAPGSTPGVAGVAGVPPAPPPGPAASGASPTKTYEQAYADYTAGLWDLSIDGFEAFLRDFPMATQAPNAQFYIGRAYMNDAKYDKAIDAFDKVIRTYPASTNVPDALFLKGESLRSLKQADAARDAYSTVITKYPDSTAATLAKQRMQTLGAGTAAPPR